LQRAQHRGQVVLVYPPHVTDANDLSVQATLAASQDYRMTFLERSQQHPGADPGGNIRGGHCRRGKAWIGQQAQIEVEQPLAGELGQSLVPREHLLQPFGAHQPQRSL
jgi:hypothetical protein